MSNITGNKLTSFRLTQWKQFSDVIIQFHPTITIITGSNGSGKTTILSILARQFNWTYVEAITPIIEDESGQVLFYGKDKMPINSNSSIGSISYSNGITTSFSQQPTNSQNSQSQITIWDPQQLSGTFIQSNRPQYRYQTLESIPAKKRTKNDAQAIFNNRLVAM